MAAKIALLHASIGTGHKAAALALADWWTFLYPDTEVVCRDLLDYVPSWIKKSVTSSYLTMARKSPWIWERLYVDTDAARRKKLSASFWRELHTSISRCYIKNLFKELDAFDPDAVIVTHFFGMSALLDKWEHRTPIFYVGTDFATHHMQRDPRYDGWFVGSEEAARQYRADKVLGGGSAVQNVGVPIARAYAAPPSREEARTRLGIEEGRTAVLIAGGGIGAGALGEVADSILDYENWQVDIVCGNNTKMFDLLRDKYHPFDHIRVHGFVDDMHDRYAACDIAVLKPGGLSCAEALASGCAVFLLDPLYGLERYNSDYLLEQGAARKILEIRKTGEMIADLLKSPETLRGMRQRAAAAAHPGAAESIVRAVMDRIRPTSPEENKEDTQNKEGV